MKRYWKHLIASTEERVVSFLKHQVKDIEDPNYGGIKGDMIEAKPTIYAMTLAVSVYVNPESRFYLDQILFDHMNRAMDFIRNCQRSDGSFDYPSCNFKSAADTSFCFKRLIAAYRLLLEYPTDHRSKMLCEKYLIIMKDALMAIKDGGFHTPNHRWGIAAALMQGAGLFQKEAFAKELLKKANRYLAEGIDGNADGEYAERSTGNYNAVVNNAMMALYEESANEEYLGFVEGNLHMMLTFIDPDDTVFTENSTRQDQGKVEYADKYFYQYLYMTSRKTIPEFDGAAHKIIKDNMERGDLAPECLHILMLNRNMIAYEFQSYGFLEEYRTYYPESGVLRAKNKTYTYSILKNKSNFFYLKVKDTLIYVKIGESFCDIRNFIPDRIENFKESTILTSTAIAWYYKPFAQPQGTNDWWKMDHTKREILNSGELRLQVEVIELPDGIDLRILSEGMDGVPLRVEICIPANSILENEHFYLTAQENAGMILRNGSVTMHHSDQKIQIGPGFGTHEFKGHYSGEEKNIFGYIIYCNEYSPYDKTIQIRIK